MAEAESVRIAQLEKHLPSDSLYIFADIETDSIHANILLQIAAVALTGETFNKFINPGCTLSESCTNFLGLYFYNGFLYKNGRRLPSEPIISVLNQFIQWIKSFNKVIILVFHNGFSFDCMVLARFFTKFNIIIPSNLTTVCDTLPYFRKNLKATEVPNHKLSTIAKHFNITNEHEHDALSDSLTLKLICVHLTEKSNIPMRDLFKDGFRPFSDFLNQQLGMKLVPLKKSLKQIFHVEKPPKQKKTKQNKKTIESLTN